MAICNVLDRPRYLSALRGRKIGFEFPKLTPVTWIDEKFRVLKEWMHSRNATLSKMNITELRDNANSVLVDWDPIFHNLRHLTLHLTNKPLNMNNLMEALLLLETLEISGCHDSVITFDAAKLNPSSTPLQHLTEATFDILCTKWTSFASMIAHWGKHATRLRTMTVNIRATANAEELLSILQHLPTLTEFTYYDRGNSSRLPAEVQTAFDQLPTLKNLRSLSFEGDVLPFLAHCTELETFSVGTSDSSKVVTSLEQYLPTIHKLHFFELLDLEAESTPDILTLIPFPEQLHSFKCDLMSDDIMEVIEATMTNLQTLYLMRGNFEAGIFSAGSPLFSSLTSLTLSDIYISEGVYRSFFASARKFTALQSLTIHIADDDDGFVSDLSVFLSLMTSAFHKKLNRVEFTSSCHVNSDDDGWTKHFPWKKIPVWSKLTHLKLTSVPLNTLKPLFQKAPNLMHLDFRITEHLVSPTARKFQRDRQNGTSKSDSGMSFVSALWVPSDSSNRTVLCADAFRHAKKLRHFKTHLALDPDEDEEEEYAKWKGILLACPSLESFHVSSSTAIRNISYWDVIHRPKHAMLLKEFQFRIDF
jgi:hypothetical protein